MYSAFLQQLYGLDPDRFFVNWSVCGILNCVFEDISWPSDVAREISVLTLLVWPQLFWSCLLASAFCLEAVYSKGISGRKSCWLFVLRFFISRFFKLCNPRQFESVFAYKVLGKTFLWLCGLREMVKQYSCPEFLCAESSVEFAA